VRGEGGRGTTRIFEMLEYWNVTIGTIGYYRHIWYNRHILSPGSLGLLGVLGVLGVLGLVIRVIRVIRR
jgi:hypothetical protein